MNIVQIIRAFFAPTVDGAVAGLNKSLQKMEQATVYFENEEARQQQIADAATFAAREAKIEAQRAARIFARIEDILS